jgi:Flp pilus assembly pilin Flp
MQRIRLFASEKGQTTAEYALVLMGAGVVAFMLIAWAKGGAVEDLFDKSIQFLMGGK